MVQHNSIDHSGLLSVSYASNSTTVSTASAAGASSLASRGDHVHNRLTNELSYVQITSNVTPTATSEATANTVVTADAIVFDGATVVLIQFWAGNARPDTGAANRNIVFALYDGAGSVGLLSTITTPAAGGNNVPVKLEHRLTPSAGSHTYSIRAYVSAGTGLVAAGAGGTGAAMPAFIRITRV